MQEYEKSGKTKFFQYSTMKFRFTLTMEKNCRAFRTF